MKKIRTNKNNVKIEETEAYLDDLYLLVAATLFGVQTNGDIRPFEATQRTLRSLIENDEKENLKNYAWDRVA